VLDGAGTAPALFASAQNRGRAHSAAGRFNSDFGLSPGRGAL